MKNLENNLLFKSINKNDLPLLLKCLQANKITYQKDQTIIHQGQSINEIGILLSGKAHIGVIKQLLKKLILVNYLVKHMLFYQNKIQ